MLRIRDEETGGQSRDREAALRVRSGFERSAVDSCRCAGPGRQPDPASRRGGPVGSRREPLDAVTRIEVDVADVDAATFLHDHVGVPCDAIPVGTDLERVPAGRLDRPERKTALRVVDLGRRRQVLRAVLVARLDVVPRDRVPVRVEHAPADTRQRSERDVPRRIPRQLERFLEHLEPVSTGAESDLALRR